MTQVTRRHGTVTHGDRRNFRLHPFSATSPWNHPIGSSATYASFAGLSNYFSGVINYQGHWTCAVAQALSHSPLVDVRIVNYVTNWSFISGGGDVIDNTSGEENTLLGDEEGPLPSFTANYYSTTAPGSNCSVRTWPGSYHSALDDFSVALRCPAGVSPSPDTDGMFAVFQPSGWVLDCYNAIVLNTAHDGDILTPMASYIDARGDGTGAWNGRRASMFPSFAGLIRQHEWDAGLIPHALVCQFPAALLTASVAWPAAAFDMTCGYSGTVAMGSLLAIPPAVNVNTMGISARAKVLGHAMQDYGLYVGDRSGGGVNILGELGLTPTYWEDVPGDETWQDLRDLFAELERVTNNSAVNIGGGGTPRVAMTVEF